VDFDNGLFGPESAPAWTPVKNGSAKRRISPEELDRLRSSLLAQPERAALARAAKHLREKRQRQ
jgi:hypothetical protein